MPFIPGHGEAGPRRRSASKLVAAVRAVGATALVRAAAGCAPATDRYDTPLGGTGEAVEGHRERRW